MLKTNPFTPKSGIAPRVFLDRDEEIAVFLRKIEETKSSMPAHYVINGTWGIGKTTLLKYFKVLAQTERCFAAYFSAREFKHDADDGEIIVHILQSIANDLPIKLKEKSNFFKAVRGFGIQVLGAGISLEFSANQTGVIDAQTLLSASLRKLWDDVKDKTELIAILIDDVQNWADVSRFFTLLKNVLSEESINKNTRYLFVLSSTVEGWQQFMVRNHPIGRFFIPRSELKRFDETATAKLVKTLLDGTGVNFSDEVIRLVFEFTRGHLFEIHALCASLYECEMDGKVGLPEWEKGFEKGLLYLGAAVFDSYLQLPEREKEVIIALSQFDTAVELNHIIKKCKELKFAVKNINQHMRRLVEKKIIQNISRGNYFIEDRLFREYVKTKWY